MSEAVLSQELDLKQSPYRHPTYRFLLVNPNSFGQAIELGSSRMQSEFNIPNRVYNMGLSELSFDLTLPANATNAIWLHEDVLGPIGQIQYYPNNSNLIVDLDNANKYMKALKCEMSQEELERMDPMCGLHISNTLRNAIPALRCAVNTGGVLPSVSDRNYTESAYFSSAPVNTARTIHFRFPLKIFKNTFFAMCKDTYIGQTTFLKIYWDVLSRICYMSDNPNDPSGGTRAAYVPGVGSSAQIENLKLFLAVEDDPAVAESVKQKFTAGLSMMIPFTKNYKNNNSGDSQNITIQCNTGNGSSLQKVLHQVYNKTEEKDTAYDCSNNGTLVDGTANATANQKVLTYYTQLNSSREQDLTLDCTGAGRVFTDYLQIKRKLEGSKSVLQSLNQYQYNWVHCSDYSDNTSQDDNGNLISGIPLGAQPLIWSFVGNSMNTANAGANGYLHYTWMTFNKVARFDGGAVDGVLIPN